MAVVKQSETDSLLLQADSACSVRDANTGNYTYRTFGGCVSLRVAFLLKSPSLFASQVLLITTVWHFLTGRIHLMRTPLRVCFCQTNVCTGVMERVGEPARSEEEEAERLVTSRCNSSTLFCSSARFANSSL